MIDKGNKIFCFTDADLDGAGSYLMLHWLSNINIPYKIASISNFRETFLNWLKVNKITDYDQIYILDLDTSAENLDLVDHSNITIIDHHDSHIKNADNYKKATTIIEKCGSCTKLIYNLNKPKSQELSRAQKHLVGLVNDYDSHELKSEESWHLNIIYWNYQGDRLQKFTDNFKYGFLGFTPIQKKAINFYRSKFEKTKQTLQIYHADLPIGKKTYKGISTFANEFINEISDYILKEYNADISFVINSKSKRVSFRKNTEHCKVHLQELAKRICETGGGHDDAAGGSLDDKFLAFSKIFKSIDE